MAIENTLLTQFLQNSSAKTGWQVMQAVYGQEEAPQVLQRIFEIDQGFGELALETTYGKFWADDALSLKEKSIITIVSLATIKDGERLGIHFLGFFHLGGTVTELQNLLESMLTNQWIDQDTHSNAQTVLSTVCTKKSLQYLSSTGVNTFSKRETALIKLAALVAQKNEKKLDEQLREMVTADTILNDSMLRAAMRLQITYCGCPPVMQGLDILTKLQQESS